MISNQNLNETEHAAEGCENLKYVYAEAKSNREWLEALPVEANLRDYLVEPVAAAEVEFFELLDDEQPRA